MKYPIAEKAQRIIIIIFFLKILLFYSIKALFIYFSYVFLIDLEFFLYRFWGVFDWIEFVLHSEGEYQFFF